MINNISEMNLQRRRKAVQNPVHDKSVFNNFFAWTKNFENAKFCVDCLSPSTSVYFSGLAGGRSLRARVPYVTRRAVLPKSNTAPGVICAVRGQSGFSSRRVFTAEFLEICKFILMSEYFSAVFFRLWLSIRVVKSKNEFVATEDESTKGVGHVTNIFRKIRLFRNIFVTSPTSLFQ